MVTALLQQQVTKVVVGAFVLFVPAIGAVASPNRLAVTFDDFSNSQGFVRAMTTTPPFEFVTPAIDVGLSAVARHAGDRLYVVSADAARITVVDEAAWTVVKVIQLAPQSGPVDLAVVDAKRAYLTRSSSAHLERIDLTTGDLREVVDLSPFADADGNPDLGMMVLFEGRLFIQIRRLDQSQAPIAPPYLAVLDVDTEQLVDVDPGLPGVQAITLEGTAPRFKMQAIRATRTLWISATGIFHDSGGYERVNLDTLQSLGLAIQEQVDINVDAGPIIMVAPDRGYVTSSTDLLLSSHVRSFKVNIGLDEPEWFTTLGYFIPAFEYDPPSDHLFIPEGNTEGIKGVHVFHAASGARLTDIPVETAGQPTDLELMCPCPEVDCSLESVCVESIPSTSNAGLMILAAGIIAAGLFLAWRGRTAQPRPAGR